MTNRMSATRPGAREPLLAVDDPLVAVAHGVGPEEVRVRPALGLGHRVRRPDLLVEHRLEPALLLLLGAVGGEHLHVAGVGRGRAEHLRRRRVAAEDLVQQPELELAVAGPAEVLVEEDRPQALGLDLVLQALHQRLDLRVLRPDRVREHVLERLDLLPAELLDPVELLLELRLGREVPTPSDDPRARSVRAQSARSRVRAAARTPMPRPGHDFDVTSAPALLAIRVGLPRTSPVEDAVEPRGIRPLPIARRRRCHVGDRLGHRLDDHIGDRLDDRLGRRLDDRLDHRLDDGSTITSTTGSATGSATGSTTGSTITSTTGSATGSALTAAISFSRSAGGRLSSRRVPLTARRRRRLRGAGGDSAESTLESTTGAGARSTTGSTGASATISVSSRTSAVSGSGSASERASAGASTTRRALRARWRKRPRGAGSASAPSGRTRSRTMTGRA